jgi:hypothetical protein
MIGIHQFMPALACPRRGLRGLASSGSSLEAVLLQRRGAGTLTGERDYGFLKNGCGPGRNLKWIASVAILTHGHPQLRNVRPGFYLVVGLA